MFFVNTIIFRRQLDPMNFSSITCCPSNFDEHLTVIMLCWVNGASMDDFSLRVLLHNKSCASCPAIIPSQVPNFPLTGVKLGFKLSFPSFSCLLPGQENVWQNLLLSESFSFLFAPNFFRLESSLALSPPSPRVFHRLLGFHCEPFHVSIDHIRRKRHHKEFHNDRFEHHPLDHG